MILVTGGTGFVGSHLVRRMRREGLPCGYWSETPIRRRRSRTWALKLFRGDISDKASLEKAVAGC